MVKQLKQMDKERKEKDIRLKTQEKKVCVKGRGGGVTGSTVITWTVLVLRLTILSVPSGWWRFHCWRSSIESRFGVIVSFMSSRKKKRWE